MTKTIAILFGGKSVEHEISIRSAKNVVAFLDKSLFSPVIIGITKQGDWYLCDAVTDKISSGKVINLSLSGKNAGWVVEDSNQSVQVDLVFPILHGTDGEDGSVQGMLKAVNLPTIGCDVLGAAICMDKIISKKLLEQAGIPVSTYLDFSVGDSLNFEEISAKLGLPFMVKAGNQGSSVGISKVTDKKSFELAVADSFQYSTRILIESFVKGRELECAILGNETVESTDAGEIILNKNYDFYTYEAKYKDEKAISIEIPAKLDSTTNATIREFSEKAFKALRCNDYARVDVFVTEDGGVLINEINTIPGFTNVSMFPMLWQNMGLEYTDLLTKIIQLGQERWAKNARLQTSYDKA